MSEAQDIGASAAALSTTVLEEEAARQAEHREQLVIFPDDVLPGVGGEPLSFKEGLAKGGAFTFWLLLILASLDELQAGALGLLAPNIRDSFGISNGTITFIAAAGAAFVVLGAFPMGWLADRYRRGPIIAISTVCFTGFVFLTGLAVNAFMLFVTQFGVGIAKSSTIPVHGSLLADAYPITIRGRMAAMIGIFGRSVAVISPAIIGAIVVIAGGDDGWRWAFLILGFPVLLFALLAFRLPEPPRGQWEMDDVLGSVIAEEKPAPISVEAAFSRLLRIRTMRSVLVGFCALGFLLFTLGVQSNIYLEEQFGLDTFGRGLVASIIGVAGLVFLPFVGVHFDRLYRRDPEQALRLIGILLLPLAVLVPLQFLMPNVYLFVAVGIPVQVLFTASFAMVAPTVQAIVPYRLRGMGAALVTVYIFLIGAIGGALLAALLVDAYGPRAAIIAIAAPALVVGGLMLLRGSQSIKYDLSLIVGELRDELEEHERQRDTPDEIPAVQVSNLDFSYGAVQVLFDLNFSVAKGETLALLGTNGAGKSTILKVITGLGTPERGVIRLNGQSITYCSPEQRAAMGIQMLPGGQGTFPNLTIRDNLVVGAYRYRKDRADVQRRIDRVLEMFPVLADRGSARARDLSGGQQQLLALARVMMHEPEVLIIDELSLGLAPKVVQDLLEHIARLKTAGQTMIIVEQSLNVALAVADRAVFMEKGQVRFEGPARELAERDDLARAVFFGSEGG